MREAPRKVSRGAGMSRVAAKLLGVTLVLGISTSAFCAAIKSAPGRGGSVIIQLSGGIVPGDGDALVTGSLRARERGVYDSQAVVAAHKVNIRDPKNAPKLIVRDLHWTGGRGGARRGLGKRRRHSRVEGHVTLDLLHHLVNMSIQYRD